MAKVITKKFAFESQVSKRENYDNLMKFAVDYLNHNQVERSGRIRPDARLAYNDNIALEEKDAKMHKLFMGAIEEFSGFKYDGDGSKASVVLYSQNPLVKWATFAVVDSLISMILPDSIIAETGVYAETKFVGFGDTANFDLEDNALYDVYRVGRDRLHQEAQSEYMSNVTLNPTNRIVTVKAQWYKLITGEMNLGRFAMKAADSIANQIAYDAYQAMDTAFATLETSGNQQLQWSGFNEDNLLEACQKVEAWNNGAKTVIAGTRQALAKVLPANTGLRIQVDSPYVSTGYIRGFRGYDTFELYQKADWRTEFSLLLNNTRLYIVSPGADKPIKIAMEGQTRTYVDGSMQNADLSQNASIVASWEVKNVTNSIGALFTNI